VEVKVSRMLFKAARTSRDLKALSTGRIGSRLARKTILRTVAPLLLAFFRRKR